MLAGHLTSLYPCRVVLDLQRSQTVRKQSQMTARQTHTQAMQMKSSSPGRPQTEKVNLLHRLCYLLVQTHLHAELHVQSSTLAAHVRVCTCPAASTSGVALQGSLYGPSDAQMGQWREFLATRKGKDAALFLRKWMREALRKAGIQTKMRFKAGSRTYIDPDPLHSYACGMSSSS